MAEPTALRLHDNQSFPDQLGYAPAASLLDWRRSILSSTTILQANAGHRKGQSPAGARNKKISEELGRKGKWKEMLFIHEKENEGFNHVNYATTMSQLGRNRYVDHQDPFFRAFLDDLGNQVEVRGLRWLQVQQVANIMYAIVKMNLKNHRTTCLLFLQVEKHAGKLAKQGHLQNIANTVWACATLGVESPNLFSQVEKHAE
eukprot:scaffold71520_cov50-Attheya_sp.AAC.11